MLMRIQANVQTGLVYLLVALAAIPTAQAQTGTATVSGTVSDQQGRVIPAAVVTLTSVENGSTRTQNTGAGGNFSFDLLPPGDYKLDAEAPNFKKAHLDSVHALVATPLELAVVLQVGTTGEIVTVSAENAAVQVNTQDSSLGNNFVNSQIEQLPLEARNVLSLLTLQPGVTKDGYVAGTQRPIERHPRRGGYK